jgi:hypothetical protein
MDKEGQSTQEDWASEFKEECARNLQRSVADRIRYGFTYEYKPILDDTPWRSFDSMAQYRRWCNESLPSHLGYGTSDEFDQNALDRQTALIARREIDRRKKLQT